MGEKNVVDLTESLEPEGFELNQRCTRLGKVIRIAANDSFASHCELAHELGALEYRHVC